MIARVAAVLAYLFEVAKLLRRSAVTIGREAVELRGLAFDLRDLLHSKT